MKKFLLVISLLLPMLFSHVSVSSANDEENIVNENCDNETSIVKIVDNYDEFQGNGIIYKIDENYSYVILSSKMLSNVNSYKVIYRNNVYSSKGL